MLNRLLSILTLLAVSAGPLADAARGADDEDPPNQAAAEFQTRLAEITVSELDEAMELAGWAMDEELLDEADGLYRAILRADPDHADAWHVLKALADIRPLPKPSEAATAARAALPASFVEIETRRYVVYSDADPDWVRVQAERLERAHAQFFRFSLALDLRALPLRHKLVAVVFDDRADFVAFARHHDHGVTSAVAGYYSLADDWLVFYHVESNANVLAARSELEQLYAEADRVRRGATRARMTRRRDEASERRAELERRLAHLDDRERALNIFAHQRSVAVSVHEAVHQLMFHTGVQSPYVDHPMWLTEGLATSFETDDPRSAFGPLRDFGVRREAFWSLLDDDRLLPLRDLVRLTPQRVGADRSLIEPAYNQSYALVAWMVKHRKLALRQYLRDLNALPNGRPTPAVHLDVFEKSFGDIDRLEEAWLRYERAQ